MKMRIAAVSAVVLTMALTLALSASGAVIGVYRNAMGSEAQRAQIVKLFGERCGRGGSEQALRVTIGKATSECGYRTPVIGRDLEVAVTARLLSGTPKEVRNKAFLAVDLRAGQQGAGYRFAVYPLQRKAQLRKTLPDGQVKYLQIAKDLSAVKGINQATQLRLRAFNVTSGPDKGACRVLAFVGRQMVADVTDAAAGELQGRASGISLGAAGNAKGAIGSFDDIVVRVPSPF